MLKPSPGAFQVLALNQTLLAILMIAYLRSVFQRYWISDQGVYEIYSVDNAQHRIIAWNMPGNPTEPGKYSAFIWST